MSSKKNSNKPFIVDNKAYRFKERDQIFQNKEALKLLNLAQGNMTGSYILGGLGGFGVGYGLVDMIFLNKQEKSHQWQENRNKHFIIAGVGAVIAGIGFSVAKSGTRKMEQAVKLENKDISARRQNENTWKVDIGTNSISLKYTF